MLSSESHLSESVVLHDFILQGLRAFLPKAELLNRVNNFTELKENVWPITISHVLPLSCIVVSNCVCELLLQYSYYKLLVYAS